MPVMAGRSAAVVGLISSEDMAKGYQRTNLDQHFSSWPGIAVQRTASLPLAYARPSTSFLRGRSKTWMPGTRPGMTIVGQTKAPAGGPGLIFLRRCLQRSVALAEQLQQQREQVDEVQIQRQCSEDGRAFRHRAALRGAL